MTSLAITRKPPIHCFASYSQPFVQLHAVVRHSCCRKTSFCPQSSRTTSVGFLSSRKPRKTGARNFPSRVHSANLISATNFGFSQYIFFIMEGVIPCTHCAFCFDGKSMNGQSARACSRNFLCSIAKDFVVNPVPTFPAKMSFPFR